MYTKMSRDNKKPKLKMINNTLDKYVDVKTHSSRSILTTDELDKLIISEYSSSSILEPDELDKLYRLNIHEYLSIDTCIDTYEILRVPGGWIYTGAKNSVFVPYIKEEKESENKLKL